MSLKTFIHDFYENAINGKAKTRALLAPFVADEALMEHVAFFEAGFPKYSIAIADLVEEGNKVVVRATFHGTHAGMFNGIPPTGKTVTLPFLMMYQVENEKIVQHWLEADTMSLLTQLGVGSAAAQPAL
jgi:predicted ester cyclase